MRQLHTFFRHLTSPRSCHHPLATFFRTPLDGVLLSKDSYMLYFSLSVDTVAGFFLGHHTELPWRRVWCSSISATLAVFGVFTMPDLPIAVDLDSVYVYLRIGGVAS